tara:strand:- start:128 stop:514 length:387 start_codon:yes stop_codon:yes gene_type:complete
MSKTLLSAFNNNLNNFITELIKTYPQEHNFIIFKNTILLMQRVNPRKVLLLFIEYINPYKEKLLSRDESFFLNENYSSILNQTENKDNAWQLIDKLKLYWRDTSESNKNVIWMYFKQLITLGYMSYNN